MRALPSFSILSAALLLAACDQAGTSTALDRPTTPPTNVASFNGTLQLLGTVSYTFSVSADGYVEVTLLGLAAPPGTKVELGIGTPSLTGTCATNQSVTTEASSAAQIIGTGIAGTHCVTLTDVGNLTAPALYTITVASS